MGPHMSAGFVATGPRSGPHWPAEALFLEFRGVISRTAEQVGGGGETVPPADGVTPDFVRRGVVDDHETAHNGLIPLTP
jgi:hypothetical protein